ncbi:hypothetical protein FH972_023166 [Carpinus fangiana]|uniref:Cell division control protein 14 n=1 Tax=Carpinus fangiana TaxID=176857 RepID=A0A5N6KUE6_9ROSI|nr:hypothetical protein FH972_023166 [Carpinus fangiana]
MDTLLTLSFDNISSKNPDKIRKGLRQIEGLLAQICLARSETSPQSHYSTASSTTSSPSPIKSLEQLTSDPAFDEFYRLQQSFEYNLASRLTDTLDRLLGLRSNTLTDNLLLSTLTVLHGTLLLHPPSRHLFSRETSMLALLDLLDPATPPPILSAAVLTLVSALLDSPRCARAFEAADGLRTVASLFRARATPTEVKMKIVEFLYFYLMPEPSASTSRPSSADAMVVAFGGMAPPTPASTPLASAQSSLAVGHARAASRSSVIASSEGAGFVIAKDDTLTRSTEDKQRMLGRYLSNVEDLVQDLREAGSLPGGGGGTSVAVF